MGVTESTTDSVRKEQLSNGQKKNGQSYSDIKASGDELLLPADSEVVPTLSVVMPTLNEEDGIAQCIEWIKNALEELQVYGEIIVSDSSTDRTPEIADEMGAIVVEPDKKGYGYAYLYAFERTRGDYIAMGDADCTYDFEELPKLLNLVRAGEADMAMGSRLEGEILPGSMPPLHEHVGNPLLTKFLNVFYGAGVSDAHSGMRVFSRKAWETMDCDSTGMEFASEMIMEAGAKDLEIAEKPITYHPREGEANLESFPDGWRHVRFMLVNAPGYLFSAPGFGLSLVGLVALVLAWTGMELGGATFGIHTGIAGGLSVLAGFQLMLFGAFATVSSDPVRGASDPFTTLFTDRLSLERGATIGSVVLLGGLAYGGFLAYTWVTSGFSALPIAVADVVATVAVVLGLQMMFGSFLLGSVE
ncbi:glycosyltransferase family 2 protein [Haloferax larsenii]|uniref:Glycosyltransferase family 2 protein n=1 Tax=Haloferax larsenii TaxID=302484 RepID=A0ABY5REG6_HALLR|nr:glycosyltransferase family 2 protein [Haloferax larsenii]UVE50737.1 glycosyltransferase family 2 protein [Haloferax larsenii]